jgi:nitrous oxidase accessory protein NosD
MTSPDLTKAPRSVQPLPLSSQPESKMLIVDRQNRGDYTSIAEAIAQAPEGSLIVVRPGHYSENLSIDRPLTLMGDGSPLSIESVEIHGSIVINAANVSLQNLKIYITDLSEFASGGVLPQGFDDFRRLAASYQPQMLAGASGTPVNETAPPGLDQQAVAVIVLQGSVVLQDCVLQGGRGSAIHVCNAKTRLTARNCLIQNSDAGIYQAPYTHVELEQCEIHGSWFAQNIERLKNYPVRAR